MVTRTYQVVAIIDWCIYNILLLKQSLILYSNKMSPLFITGAALVKHLTLGGIGIWWIVDVLLLITGNLRPEDGSNWVPYY